MWYKRQVEMKKGFFLFFLFLIFQQTFSATYTVTTTGNGTTTDGTTLRWAITQANGGTGNKIHFNIAGAAPHTITITSALPTIADDNIVIDGSTQALNGGSGDPKIIIDGGSSVGTGIQLSSTKDGLQLLGLHIKGFTDYGIRADGSTITIGGTASGKRVVVSGCGSTSTEGGIWAKTPTILNTFVGTDSTGNTAAGNTGYGIKGVSAGLITIGSNSADSRCVISNNSNHGIFLDNCDNSVIKNCYIGVNYAGDTDFGNGGAGVYGNNASNPVTVGGTGTYDGNVISGNTTDGVYVSDADGWIFYGNKFGTNAAGTAAIANGESGIHLDNTSTAPIIGGTAAGQPNIFSGNTLDGMTLDSDTDNASVLGNKIGTDVNGTGDLGNGRYGIYMLGSTTSGNTIGGTASLAQRNYIAYNTTAGIAVNAGGGITTDDNQFRRNYIFCNGDVTPLGIDLISNGNDGVATPVVTSADGSNVSGTSADDGNVDVYLDDFGCGCQGKNWVATGASSGGSWSITCANCFNGDVVVTTTVTSMGTSEFSNCQTTGVLPIELLLFKANAKDGKVYLYWSTASETNNDYFTIERTRNGKTFESIGTLKGNGTSTQVLNYIYTDAEPLSGRSFYRLKQTDYDGKFEYSILVPVNIGEGKPEFKVYPNPSLGETVNVFLSGVEDEHAAVIVTDQAGRIIFNEIIGQESGSFFESIPTGEKISAGIYFVTVKTNHGTFHDKLVVK